MSQAVQLFLPSFTPTLFDIAKKHGVEFLELFPLHQEVWAVVTGQRVVVSKSTRAALAAMPDDLFNDFTALMIDGTSQAIGSNVAALLRRYRRMGGV